MSTSNRAFFEIADGIFKACGVNSFGELGLGNITTYTALPTEIPLSNIASISTGINHTFFLLKDNTVRCVGRNNYGQLGLDDKLDKGTVINNPGLTDVKVISCNESRTVVLFKDGTAKGCGVNSDGQLGIGLADAGLGTWRSCIGTNIKDIACGSDHTLFLFENGEVKATGYNYAGQVGDNTVTTRSTPVLALSNVKEIFAGSMHSFAIMNDGTVKGWGLNTSGQLGLGDLTNRLIPTTINITNVKSIIAGTSHTIFLMNDGTVKGCGSNGNFQLGLASTTLFSTIQNLSHTDIVDVLCGANSSIFLKNDGTYIGTGVNTAAQLGINSANGATRNGAGVLTGVSALAQNTAKIVLIKKFLLKLLNKLFKINGTNLLNVTDVTDMANLKTHGVNDATTLLGNIVSITINTLVHSANIYKTPIDKNKLDNLTVTLNTTGGKSLIKINNSFYKITAGVLSEVTLGGADIAISDLTTNGMDNIIQSDLLLLPSIFDIYTYTTNVFTTTTLSFTSKDIANCFSNIELVEYSNMPIVANCNIIYIPSDTLIMAESSIDLSLVEDITDIELLFNISGAGVIKIIASTDEGFTWYTYNSGWEVISPNVTDVLSNGLTPEAFSLLGITWNTLPDILTNKKVKFAYALSVGTITDVAETTQLTINYNAKGKYKKHPLSGCNIGYTDSSTMRVTFVDTGIYKINVPRV